MNQTVVLYFLNELNFGLRLVKIQSKLIDPYEKSNISYLLMFSEIQMEAIFSMIYTYLKLA